MNARRVAFSVIPFPKPVLSATLLVVSVNSEETVSKSKSKIAPFSTLMVNAYNAKKSTLWTHTPESASKSQKQAEYKTVLSILETISVKYVKKTSILPLRTDVFL